MPTGPNNDKREKSVRFEKVTSVSIPREQLDALPENVQEYINMLRIENADLHEEREKTQQRITQLEDEALRDPFTGVYHKNAFKDKLKEAILTCSKHPDSEKTLVFIDLNYLTYINNTHGYIAGDNFIKIVADQLKENLRSADIIGRTGGDEIAIITDGSNEESTKNYIENLSKKIVENLQTHCVDDQGKSLEFNRKPLPFSLAVGCRQITPDSTYAGIYSVAEGAMKKNKVQVKSELPEDFVAAADNARKTTIVKKLNL